MMTWQKNITNYTGLDARLVSEKILDRKISESCFQYVEYTCPATGYRIATLIMVIITLILLVELYKDDIKKLINSIDL